MVAKYILSQLQRLYGPAGAGGGSSNGRPRPPGETPAAGAVGYADGFPARASGNGAVGGVLTDQSAAALQLFNTMLPALSQSLAQVRAQVVVCTLRAKRLLRCRVLCGTAAPRRRRFREPSRAPLCATRLRPRR
jgi:hypothetical protein